jgi:preprotein translocase subunit SecG
MEIIKVIFQITQGLSALFLIIFVLLHSPKGDGIGGIGSSAQIFSSQKGAEAALTKTTAWIAGVFYLASFILGHFLK